MSQHETVKFAADSANFVIKKLLEQHGIKQTFRLSNRKPFNMLCYSFFFSLVLERGKETCQAVAKKKKS